MDNSDWQEVVKKSESREEKKATDYEQQTTNRTA